MSFPLPSISRANFAAGLTPLSPVPLDPKALKALFAHYLELSFWNRRLSLIGRGTIGEILERHYGEALAALPLLPEPSEGAVLQGLDAGSGAGFPGMVLAAARPDLEMTLVEAQERKWAFLASAARKASLPCRCLNARVSVPLPADFPASLDLVTTRALKLGPDVLGALGERLSPEGRILLWVGADVPLLPPTLVPGRCIDIPGSWNRRILELRRFGGQGSNQDRDQQGIR